MHNVHTLSAASLHIIDEGWNMEYENSFYFGDSIDYIISKKLMRQNYLYYIF